MNGTLHRVFDHAFKFVDALDDLIGEAALGFGAAAPMIIDPNDDAPCEPSRTVD
ncbi:hypothetical protein MKK75_09585 [Methylobacterium sp. J-030]|uniref:hypothetical protein n=1 Tax=Methylobacterium sp. J-030 TaxID=2836627 RepID=UPI001FBB65A5|nr:hypothetical protein [Methylobacterium sp. J-030]MCJ2069050.1 hypothetical protein [Methylobacterium sp. J-030]